MKNIAKLILSLWFMVGVNSWRSLSILIWNDNKRLSFGLRDKRFFVYK